MGAEFQVCKMKSVLGADRGDGCTAVWNLVPHNHAFKNGEGAKFHVLCVLQLKDKEGNSDADHKMDEPWRCYVQWTKPVTKRQTLSDSTGIVRFRGPESRWWLPGAGGRGDGKLVFHVYRVSVWEDEEFREMDSVDSCLTRWIYSCHWLVH